MLRFIHHKYNILRRYTLELQRTKEGHKEELLNVLCLLKILSGVGHKIVHYYLHSPFHMFLFPNVLFDNRGSDVSNFIGSDQKDAPYHLDVFR